LTKAPSIMAEADISIVRIAPETSFKNKAYEALKEAILKMDIYATPEQVMLDERALSERLGVSRTPIREAIAMLEQDGFVKTVPRRGIVVVRRTKTEIVDMIRAWAALESMAARLITTTARKKDITALRDFFKDFGKDRLPQDHVEEYSKANIAFHQALISLSESPVLVDMTNDILLHVRGYRQLTIGRKDRTATSLPEHLGIIEALEARDTELTEKRARDHTLGLAAYVEGVAAVIRAFPDYHWDLQQVVVQGDTVCARLIGRGTHTGSFSGIAPTGATISVQELVVYRFAGGKIVQCWGDLYPVVRDELASLG
jgi:DNA-binding GntR family transcriptional regulator